MFLPWPRHKGLRGWSRGWELISHFQNSQTLQSVERRRGCLWLPAALPQPGSTYSGSSSPRFFASLSFSASGSLQKCFLVSHYALSTLSLEPALSLAILETKALRVGGHGTPCGRESKGVELHAVVDWDRWFCFEGRHDLGEAVCVVLRSTGLGTHRPGFKCQLSTSQ